MNITFEREWCSFLLGKKRCNNVALYFEKSWVIGDSFVNIRQIVNQICKLEGEQRKKTTFE